MTEISTAKDVFESGMPAPSGPFGDGGPVYAGLRYTGMVPVNVSEKTVALKGVTGRDGVQTKPEQYTGQDAVRQFCRHNIGWRLPLGIIGLDVDQYDGKHGAEQLDELQSRLGPLPATWSSTSRGDGPSRIHFFRVPEDTGELKGNAAEDIEVIQHHHRYAIVWPSVHPSGREYAWYNGVRSETPPSLDQFAALPQSWLEYLAKPQRENGPGAGLDVDTFVETYTKESDPGLIVNIRAKFESREGCRHDTMLKALGWAARASTEGKVSARGIFGLLEEDWHEATGGGRQSEFDDLLSTAVADAPDPAGDEVPEEAAEPVQTRLDIMRGKLLTPDALKSRRLPQYLIRGWLKERSSVRMNGQPGSAKSLHLLDMAGCIGAGIPWHGHQTRQGTVVYLIAEGVDGFMKRVVAWERHYGRPMENVIFYPEPVQILGRAPGERELGQSPEWADFTALCTELSPDLVILDTQRRVTLAAEENSNSDLQKAVECLDRMKRQIGCTWLLGHHTPKDGQGGSGGGAMWGSVDSEWETSKKKAGLDAEFTLENTKEKDDEDGRKLRFKLRQYDLTGLIGSDPDEPRDPWADPITSVVMVLEEAEEVIDVLPDLPVDPNPSRQAILEIIRRIYTSSTPFLRSEVYRVTVPKVMSKPTFYRAWAGLVHDGVLRPELLANGSLSKVSFSLPG